MSTTAVIKNISGIILSGGKSSRMGEDKALKKIHNKTLIEFTITKIQHQVNSISINTNQNQDIYKKFGYPLISDINPDHLGPLSGIYSSLKKITTNWAFFTACDTPYLPKDIVIRLYNETQKQDSLIATVETNNKIQPLVSLIHKELLESLNKFLSSGKRKTQQWILQQQPAILDCSNQIDAFSNINTPEDFLTFERNQKH